MEQPVEAMERPVGLTATVQLAAINNSTGGKTMSKGSDRRPETGDKQEVADNWAAFEADRRERRLAKERIKKSKEAWQDKLDSDAEAEQLKELDFE
jgi:hypothetical protein